MIGRTLAHYRITAELGSGGMGVVYRAEDTRLGRNIAIKILPPEMAADEERLERFRREARALAALDHPNIVTVHSVEEADGVHFLTMALVEGTTLDAAIPDEGLSVERFLEIASELADALAAAHEKGVIHRDLKPANVMVTESGRIVILDFGLAKIAHPDPPDERPTDLVTREGHVMGTVPYMSPEQLSGSAVDARSDVFSLGILLYELASGQRPFRGPTLPAVMSAILTEPPEPLGVARPSFPAAVGRLIERCLQKDPAARPQSARELASELVELDDHSAPTVDGLAAPRVPPRAAQEPRKPLIGREQERAFSPSTSIAPARVVGRWCSSAASRGWGKRTWSRSFCAMRASAVPLTGHCYEEEERAPFTPFVEMLEQIARDFPKETLREALGESAPEVAGLLPELRRLYPDMPPPAELPPEQQQRYLFRSVREFLERLGRSGPLVILFDDLHWADDSSLLLLQHLAQHLSEMPLLALGTYRDVELEVGRPFAKLMATLVRQDLAERLALKRLSETLVADLLAALGGVDPPPELVSAIFDETEGNPYFVQEVYQHLAEEGRLFDEQGRYRGSLDVSALEVPECVRLVIGRRLERLDPETPKVLTRAAVIGRRFDLRILEAMEGTDPDTVLDAIEQAEAAQLIRSSASGREARYEFGHELIRQTLIEAHSLPRRQRLHLRVAEAMEKVLGDRVNEQAADVAHHLYSSGAAANPEKTYRFLKRAGIQALEAAAAGEAVAWFDKAFEIAEEIGERARAEALELRGNAKRAQGRWEEATRDWSDALPYHEHEKNGQTVAMLCWEIGYWHLWGNRRADARAIAERGMAAVGDEPSSGRGRAHRDP